MGISLHTCYGGSFSHGRELFITLLRSHPQFAFQQIDHAYAIDQTTRHRDVAQCLTNSLAEWGAVVMRMMGEPGSKLPWLSREGKEACMAEKEYILKLLYRAFLDIRIASYSQDSHTCFVLADIFHTVPLQMHQAENGEKSYADIVMWIQKKCEERSCTSWLDTASADIAKMP
jgi:hypothetical protein